MGTVHAEGGARLVVYPVAHGNPWFGKGLPFIEEHWQVEVREVTDTEEVTAGEG